MANYSVLRTPYWINQTAPLFVVQHLPQSASVSKTAVIILNSGFLHNVGPYRLSVDLADAISSLGFVVVRVDQSGKGDSPVRDDLAGREAKLQDFDEVFAHLKETYGVSECILIGLCSGADDALEIAEMRDTVTGLVFLDGFSPVTFGYYFHHYFTRIRYIRSWLRWKKRIKAKRAKELEGGSELQCSTSAFNAVISLRRWSDERAVKLMYESVLERGVKIMAVFTGGAGDYYNHSNQLSKGLSSSTVGLHEVYFQEASHIYPNPVHRAKLVEDLKAWVSAQFVK